MWFLWFSDHVASNCWGCLVPSLTDDWACSCQLFFSNCYRHGRLLEMGLAGPMPAHTVLSWFGVATYKNKPWSVRIIRFPCCQVKSFKVSCKQILLCYDWRDGIETKWKWYVICNVQCRVAEKNQENSLLLRINAHKISVPVIRKQNVVKCIGNTHTHTHRYGHVGRDSSVIRS